MNYRHAFHAGNFADVLKHVTFVRILEHLRTKPAPFRVIDTHAGAGLYDLSAAEANRTGEWREGIARLIGAVPSHPARALLDPYLNAVAACNHGGQITVYPGSPVLACSFLRRQDRLIACEREAAPAAALAQCLERDHRCKALAIDGWTALNAYIPPKERRGLVLIDPPFEEATDFSRLATAIEGAHRKWPTGIYVTWYPAKQGQSSDALARRLRALDIDKILRAEIRLPEKGDAKRLRACGLIIINPPWTLESELRILLPQLLKALAPDRGAYTLDWVARERPARAGERAAIRHSERNQKRTLSPARKRFA